MALNLSNFEEKVNLLLLAKTINKEIKLKKVIFSDESSIERGHGARPEYARKKGKRLPGKEMISSTNKSTFKNISNKLFFYIFLCLAFYNFSLFIAIILT